MADTSPPQAPSHDPQHPTFAGHPAGLFVLFFAEMWERFSYYGMRALLVFYMIKGFLGYGDSDAYAVYGAYTALVYMTPFFGGMLADRLLGARQAVVIGGLLMAAGHLVMTVESEIWFFVALALLIVGNGFFKPNISTIVGELYPRGSHKRDGGFTIFYIGINLGAAMSPLLCGYVGETYGWHYGFGLATIGMLTGITVFVMPRLITGVMIFAGALAAAGALLYFIRDSLGTFGFNVSSLFSVGLNIIVAIAVVVAAIAACFALGRGGLPRHVGRPPNPARLKQPLIGPINLQWAVYIGIVISVPLFVMLVSGFSSLNDGKSVTIIPSAIVENLEESDSRVLQVVAVLLEECSKPAGLVLFLAGMSALVYLGLQLFKLEKLARDRMVVALILTFFSMLFWAFFEQAGSSINNFTDRNVDRVKEQRVVTADEVGTKITIQPTQEQLGYSNGDQLYTLTVLDGIREEGGAEADVQWVVSEENVGMKIASRSDETPASTFQAVNAVFIMIFGLVFTGLWGFLDKRGLEPSTPFKFALGLLQLGLGFGALWYGAQHADERGMVLLAWLILGYLLHTTGELCLSPVGLSMITRLSPAQLVSTMMGNWFLATAFSQYLAAIIAQFTKVEQSGGGGNGIPIPAETVDVYGGVFGNIAIAAIVSALICFAVWPWLKNRMHEEELEAGA